MAQRKLRSSRTIYARSKACLAWQLFQRLVFEPRVEGLRLRQQSVGGASVISSQFDHAARGQIFRRGQQLVHHVRVGGAQILRVAGIGDHHRLALAAAAPENLARDKLLHLRGVAWQKVKC